MPPLRSFRFPRARNFLQPANNTGAGWNIGDSISQVITLATGMIIGNWLVDVAWEGHQAAKEAAKKAAKDLKSIE